MRRSIEVESYAVQMTIFEKEDDRPEILPLLKAVREANEANIDLVSYFQEKIFLDMPKTFVHNVIEELRLLGLIDSEWILTERGQETIAKEIVMIPRTGPYRLDVVNDPFLPQVIIQYSPLKIGIKSDLFRTEEENGNSITKIPSYLLNTVNSTINTLEDQPQTIVIKEIAEKGTYIPNNRQINLELHFTEYWQLYFRYRNFRGKIQVPGFFNGDQLIDALLLQLSEQADLTQWRIPQKPDLLNQNELSRFKKEFRIKNYEMNDLGSFSQVKLEDVSIFPSDVDSAKDWAIKLFIEELSSYVFGKRYANTWEELIHRYPTLREYEFIYPKIEELWSIVPFASQKYWFLRAPTDMRLYEVVKG